MFHDLFPAHCILEPYSTIVVQLMQATLLEGKNKTFTIAGYLTEPIVYYKGNGPANAKVLVNGDGNQEITIKIWSDVYKQLAANLLKVGPVSFDVTVKKGECVID